MSQLNEREAAYWEAFLRSLPDEQRPSSPTLTAEIAGNLELADDLLELYLSGRKTAGSGLVQEYEHSGEPLPKVGDYWIILRSDQTPGCIARTRRVEIHPFSEVPKEVAIAEGEGDLSLRYWREAHAAFFSPFLQQWDIDDLNKAEVVTEFFEIVYR
ncbi:ASCH domain-containing protein [Myxococcota bacterium]